MSRAGVRDLLGLRDVWSLTLTSPKARRAAIVGLLFSVLLLASACGSAAPDGPGSPDGDGEQVEAVEPEDVLSEEERTGAPEYSEWNDPAAED